MNLGYAALEFAREILGDFAVLIGVAVLIASPFVVLYMKKGNGKGKKE